MSHGNRVLIDKINTLLYNCDTITLKAIYWAVWNIMQKGE